MKTRVKMLVAAVFCGGMLFNAASQVNVNANDINFRTPSTVRNTTYHYGDLSLEDGGTLGFYGWLYSNRLIVNQTSDYISNIYPGLNVHKVFNVIGASKSFIHPHPTDTTKVVKYISIESGEALTLARGNAKTVNGEVTIKLPEHFSLVTSSKEPITVIVTPKGALVLLYTKEESKNKIVVAMKKSDFDEFRDIEFAYQVTGIRDGFEDEEVIINLEKLEKSETDAEFAKNEVKKRIIALTRRMEQRSKKKETEVK
jgi:hypothetical protein